MLYTKKGDNGTTKLFDSKEGQRINKSAFVFEVLGTLDELNSCLGYAKALSAKPQNHLIITKDKVQYVDIIEKFQQHLFCIQAELGGSDIHVTPEHTAYLEKVIQEVEVLLPPITSFIIGGGGESGAYLDVCRTIARRAERHLVLLRDNKEREVGDESITYLNRLSSALYALARFANYQEGFIEHKPTYN